MIAMYLIVTTKNVLLILICVTSINLKIYMLWIDFILALGSIMFKIFYVVITLVHVISFLYEIISISMIIILFIV